MDRSRLRLLCFAAAISTLIGWRVHASTPACSEASHAVPCRSSGISGSHPLPFFYDLYTFRGRDGRTAVVAAFAVEAGRLEVEAIARRNRYRFSVTLVLADTALRSVTNTHDTVFVDLERPLHRDHLLYTHVEILARPSVTTRQRVIVMDATTPGIGQLYTEQFPIPDYSGHRLMLSDVALGQPDAPSGWTRGDVTLALLPTTQFPSSAFDVYYEIYNLPADHAYTTEILIERAPDPQAEARLHDPDPVRLRFAGRSRAAAGAAVSELRRVETSLAPGSYRLTVTITDQVTRETASRSRTFEVRARGRGVMMVPALPLEGARSSDSR